MSLDDRNYVRAVATHAEGTLPLATARLGDEFYHQSLTLCVIEAVYSISASYTATANVITRYCEYTNRQRTRAGRSELPRTDEQESISEFCRRPELADPVRMADRVYGNRQLTSPQGGILKADAVARFARCLQEHGIEYFQDVPRTYNDTRLEASIRCIPGQRSGVSLAYFWMLAGADHFVKPDRMVLDYLGTVLNRRVRAPEATQMLRGAAEQLAAKYPGMTPRLLDYAIWAHQRAARSGATGRCGVRPGRS